MSLGERAAGVRVRPLRPEEAPLLGALHLQALRAAGGPVPSGHLDALSAAWGTRARDLPAWVAEQDGQHVGVAVCRLAVLPVLDPPDPELIALVTVDGARAEPVALALVRHLVGWAGDGGHRWLRVAAGVRLPGPVLDAARADVRAVPTVALPARP